MVLTAVFGIILFIILFFITIIRIIVWSCRYRFQKYVLKEADLAKAILQMSDGSPEKYFESLVVLYRNIYEECPDCQTICRGIAQTLLFAQEMHDPDSYEELKDILQQVTQGLEMTNLCDLPITRELLLTLQPRALFKQKYFNENMKQNMVTWIWSCFLYGGALSKCPHNKPSFCEYIQHQRFKTQMYTSAKSRDSTSSKLVYTTSIGKSAQIKNSNTKKGCKSMTKSKRAKTLI